MKSKRPAPRTTAKSEPKDLSPKPDAAKVRGGVTKHPAKVTVPDIKIAVS